MLYSGIADSVSWTAAHGNFVYALDRTDADEQVVVKYALIEPF